MLKLGQRHTLQVSDILPFGFVLTDQVSKEAASTITLKEPGLKLEVGESVEVFVYTQADGQIIASTQKSLIQQGEFANLLVLGTSDTGYYLDWGLKPDLYVPKTQAHASLDTGRYYIAKLIEDKKGKLVATTKIERFLKNTRFKSKQAVKALVYDESPLGYKCVIDQRGQGLLFKNDLSTKLSIGDELDAYIKRVRSDDKIDLSLSLPNQQSNDQLCQTILDDLHAHDGMSTLTDKSSPEDIFAHFKVSKAAYKRAIGSLYKQRKIRIEKNCIYLA